MIEALRLISSKINVALGERDQKNLPTSPLIAESHDVLTDRARKELVVEEPDCMRILLGENYEIADRVSLENLQVWIDSFT